MHRVFSWSGAWIAAGALASATGACGKSDPPPTEVGAPAKAETAKALEKEKRAAKPPVSRISRPDEYFHIIVSGPLFKAPQKFTFDPDSVRINVVRSRAAIQYVRKDNERAQAPDGSEVVVSQIQWAGGAPGEYVKDDKRSFVITLGLEDAADEPATLQIAEGKVVVDATNMTPKELKGTFEGKLVRQNEGKESETYEVSGAFNLAE